MPLVGELWRYRVSSELRRVAGFLDWGLILMLGCSKLNCSKNEMLNDKILSKVRTPIAPTADVEFGVVPC